MLRLLCIGEAMIELRRDDEGLTAGFAGNTFNTAVYCRRLLPLHLLDQNGPSEVEATPSAKPLQQSSAAVPIIRKAIAQMESKDGWVPLGAVGTRLANLASDLDPRTCGFRKLSNLARKTKAFEIDHPQGGALRIRIKPLTREKPAAKPS